MSDETTTTEETVEAPEFTQFEVGEIVKVTGPLKVTETTGEGCVFLFPGELAEVIQPANHEGSVQVKGADSLQTMFIVHSSLTKVEE